MAIGTFNMPRSKPASKGIKPLDAIDVTAKYFVYKLTTPRVEIRWRGLL
jgi:hypothetical protein